MSTNTVIVPFLLILSLIIADILCAELNKAGNPTNNNAWPKLGKNNQNESLVLPQWGPNLKSTTPWPTLQQRRPNNNQQKQNIHSSMGNQAPPWMNSNNKVMGNQPPSWVNPTNNGPMGNRPNTHLTNQQQNSNGNKPISVQNPSTGSLYGNQESNNNDKQAPGGNADDNDLTEFSEQLLLKDNNNAAKYVKINFQKMTTSRSQNDEAPLPLLTINEGAYSVPTIDKMRLLYNNYIVESSTNEVYTAQEKIEENNLLDTILTTPVMQLTRNFLIKNGKLGKDPKEFKDILRQIWFNMYSRGGGKIGSSGFEHVFLAEIKNNQVSGLHNWLYFNEEEAKKQANYLGYLKKIDLGDKGAILKYHFTFHNVDKPVGSMFIGTSPELEIALYSTCFLLRADRVCPLKMNGNRFIIRTYTYRYRGKNMIGSAFPEI